MYNNKIMVDWVKRAGTNSARARSTKNEANKKKVCAKLYVGQMQQVQCLRLAWRKRPSNISRVELDARLE